MGQNAQTGRYITGLRTPQPFRDSSGEDLLFPSRVAAVKISDVELHNTTDLVTPTGSLWFNDPNGVEAGNTREKTILSFPKPGQWTHIFRGLASMATNTGGLELPKEYSFTADLYEISLTDKGFAADIATLPGEEPDIVKALAAMGQIPLEPGGYNGNRPITRAELAEALARAVLRKHIPLDQPTYTDVPETAPGYAFIEAVTDAGVMTAPQRPDFFEPSKTVTRLELTIAAVKAAGLQAEAEQYSNATDFTFWNTDGSEHNVGLADIEGLNAAERGYVAAALKHKLITPDREENRLYYFNPSTNATRHALMLSLYGIINSLL